ncbi:hypothetical protein FRC07_015167 [Ceratobasidium sp. 392]|nr:hypothetical protein FRC07_015167 [Ceratobasidium sp. 392]
MSAPTSGVYSNLASSTLSRGTETQGQVPTLTGPPSAARAVKRTPWAGLKRVTDVMSKGANTFGPLKSAIDDMAQIVDVFERMGLSHDIGGSLTEDLDKLLSDVSGYLSGALSPAMMSSIEDFAMGVNRERELLQNKRRKIGLGRLEEAVKDDERVTECYRRIQMLLSRLALNADTNMWRTIDEQATVCIEQIFYRVC